MARTYYTLVLAAALAATCFSPARGECATSIPSEGVVGQGHCAPHDAQIDAAGPTAGLALLQRRQPSLATVDASTLSEEDSSCTEAGHDPWASGSHVGCCGGLKQCLGDHGLGIHHYRCLPTCTGGKGATGGAWCKAEAPVTGFGLKGSCGHSTEVKVLSYNLFWWNLFGQHGGGEAGKLIAESGPYDIMGFQECDDAGRVLRDAGLEGSHLVVAGGHATAIAYDGSAWTALASGKEEVGEDARSQYYGRREVVWARLQHSSSGKVVFVANHHGPLPVNSGGLCGGRATAYNMLKVIKSNAEADDVVLLLGDLNADEHSETQAALQDHLRRVAHNWVDAIFASCPATGTRRLGTGGSDHNALQAAFRI